MGALTGLLLAIGAIGGTNSWVGGSARVPFAAGVDAALPSAFARLHERYRTPHVALVVQGLAASFLFLASVFVSIGGGQTSIQESYDIMVNLTILVYFVPYLYLFAAWIRLRSNERAASDGAAITLPGGLAGVWLIATVGFAATFISIGLLVRSTTRYGEPSQLRGKPDRAVAAPLRGRVAALCSRPPPCAQSE